ncbi:hypothetical protein XK27_11105 [Streptococcus suis]|nr:hypothetical protein A7J10_10445 [Streptococcus suis]KPA63820.1 hypothetical protein XK27_11105 [Streptococcus suis]
MVDCKDTYFFLKELNKEISKIDKELVLIDKYIKTIEKEGMKCGLGIHQRYQILTDKKRLTKEIIKGIVSRFPLGKEIKEQLELQETK